MVGRSTFDLDGKRLVDIWTSVTILLEKLSLHRNYTAWLPQTMLLKNPKNIIRPIKYLTCIHKKQKEKTQISTSWFWFNYLFNNSLGWRRVASAQDKVSTGARRISVAGEINGDDLLVVRALEVSRWLQNVHHCSDVAIFPCPWLDVWWRKLCYVATNGVSVDF